MIYDPVNLIDAFYKEVAKDKFPNISKEEIAIMCRAIPLFIRTHMKRDDLPTIQIKHLGKFSVSYSKAIHLRNANEADFRAGYTVLERYEEKKAALDRVIARIVERDKIAVSNYHVDVEDDTPNDADTNTDNTEDFTDEEDETASE